MTLPIFVIDTNVLVAGLITADPHSATVRIVDAMLSGKLFFLLSPALLREYRDVLLRPKLARRHQLTPENIDQLLAEVVANALWREPDTLLRSAPPDPGDTHLWALLASEPGAILVTGDRLLLENPPPDNAVISVANGAALLPGQAGDR